MTLYKQIILEHAQNPKNQGHLPNPRIQSSATNPLCGDEICIEIRKKGNYLKDIKFSGTGCLIMKASASLVTEKAKAIGNLTQIAKMDAKTVRRLLGGKLTPAREKCALLVLQALQKALAQ